MTRSRNDVTGEYSTTIELSESDYYRIYSAARRRNALDVLLDRTAPVELEDLAVAVAERQDGLSGTDEEAVERVMTSLHHVHLPMLAKLDVIAYDTHDHRVTSCPTRSDI